MFAKVVIHGVGCGLRVFFNVCLGFLVGGGVVLGPWFFLLLFLSIQE